MFIDTHFSSSYFYSSFKVFPLFPQHNLQYINQVPIGTHLNSQTDLPVDMHTEIEKFCHIDRAIYGSRSIFHIDPVATKERNLNPGDTRASAHGKREVRRPPRRLTRGGGGGRENRDLHKPTGTTHTSDPIWPRVLCLCIKVRPRRRHRRLMSLSELPMLFYINRGSRFP